jgi:hypothetical protein
MDEVHVFRSNRAWRRARRFLVVARREDLTGYPGDDLVVDDCEFAPAFIARDNQRPPPTAPIADVICRHAPPVRALTPHTREERAA